MKRTILLAAVAVLALLASACNGAAETDTDATPAPTPDAVADPDVDTEPATGEAAAIEQAVDTTVAEGSAAFRAETTVDDDQAGSQTFEGEGVVDLTGERRQLTFDTPAGQVIVLTEGTDAYLRVPGETDAGWVQVDLAEAAGGEDELRRLGLHPLQDPTVNLDLLRAADRVEEHGEEMLDGDTTTHYEVTVDSERAAQQARDDVREAIDEATGGADAQITLEVWIDEQDRIRRIVQDDVMIDADGASATATITLELFDFGADAPETTPAQDELIELDPSLLRELLGQIEG